ncbi:MAG TPA: HAMP domain-containing protein [Streptosporangiaceae bacterium]|nr:HAMP domain-containing protein [Streptosporangiaceae bacterium]
MWQRGCRGRPAATRLWGRASPRVRLGATALCLLAAGAAVITGACGLVARDYLMGQADQQLRAYAGRLASHPFVVSPIYGIAPGAPGAPGASGPGGGVLGIEVRGPSGQLVMRAAEGAGPGPAIPAVPAGAAAHAGRPATVAAGNGGGSWRVIAEPIRYRARRIPFSYSAEGFAVFVTGRGRPGVAGTLVVGLDLGGIGRAVGRLAVTGLAVSGAVILVAACLGVAVTRAILRPVTRVEETLAAVAGGELSRRVPEPRGRTDAGRLARSLNAMLSRIEQAFSTLAESEAAARGSGARICQIIAGTGHRLRRPLGVIHGFADACRRGRRPGAGELDRMMRRVTGEAARMDAAIDDLLLARHDRPQPPG